jgi:resolvase-like protein
MGSGYRGTAVGACLTRVKATEQPIDTGTAAGKRFLDMLGVFAEFETNLRRERQLEGIAKAKRRRRLQGPAGFDRRRTRAPIEGAGVRTIVRFNTLCAAAVAAMIVISTAFAAWDRTALWAGAVASSAQAGDPLLLPTRLQWLGRQIFASAIRRKTQGHFRFCRPLDLFDPD